MKHFIVSISVVCLIIIFCITNCGSTTVKQSDVIETNVTIESVPAFNESYMDKLNIEKNIKQDIEHDLKEEVELEPSQPIEEPITPYYHVTPEEYEMLASLVFLESGGCSQDCQKAVTSVIFNRLSCGEWKKDVNSDGFITLYDIIYYPNAFSPAHRITRTKATEKVYDSVDYVIMYGPTVPEYVRYFRSDYDFNWENYKNYTTYDNVYFGYFDNWSEGAW